MQIRDQRCHKEEEHYILWIEMSEFLLNHKDKQYVCICNVVKINDFL